MCWKPAFLPAFHGLLRTQYPWIDQILIPSGNHPKLSSPQTIPDFKLPTNLIFIYNLDIYFPLISSWKRWYIVPNLRSSVSPWWSLGDMETHRHLIYNSGCSKWLWVHCSSFLSLSCFGYKISIMWSLLSVSRANILRSLAHSRCSEGISFYSTLTEALESWDMFHNNNEYWTSSF